jgi:hypothetical protein
MKSKRETLIHGEPRAAQILLPLVSAATHCARLSPDLDAARLV